MQQRFDLAGAQAIGLRHPERLRPVNLSSHGQLGQTVNGRFTFANLEAVFGRVNKKVDVAWLV
jgi:hypothetical protein